MNAYKLVQTAAAAIGEALAQGLTDGALQTAEGDFTYTATAEPREGRWAISVTDLRPRGGGRLSQGMLASFAKQIATAASRKAGAPSQTIAMTPAEDTTATATTGEPEATPPAVIQAEPEGTTGELPPSQGEAQARADFTADAQEGASKAMDRLEAVFGGRFEIQPAPAGYTCETFTPPIKAGISYYLQERIAKVEKFTLLRKDRLAAGYVIEGGGPRLEVKEFPLPEGGRRIRACGIFNGRLLIIESEERRGNFNGVARCWEGPWRGLFGEDHYKDGLLYRSQRWPMLSAEEYTAAAQRYSIEGFYFYL